MTKSARNLICLDFEAYLSRESPQLSCIIFLMLSRDLLEQMALRLWHQEDEDYPKEIGRAECDQDLLDTDPIHSMHKTECIHQGPSLASCGIYAKTRRPELHWADFSGHQKCGGIRAEVCEEVGE